MSNLTDERMEGYVVSSGDITDRVEAQLESRETSERLQELSSTTSDVLWMFDGGLVGGAVRQPAYEEVYGRPREEVEEDPEAFMEAIHPEDEPAVRDAADTVGSRFPAARIELSGSGAAPVCGLSELRSAIAELLENAIAHGDPEAPSVTVTTDRRGDRVALVVEDDAPPIPEMETNVLTGDHEMPGVYHSSGLGLWLVHWAVELSGGEVAVDSGPERGNRITVTFPCAEG